MKKRFNEKRAEQVRDKQRVDWFEEYASACVPTVRRLLIKKELEGTAMELEFYDDYLMQSEYMPKELLNFILDWRKVLMKRMEMLNEQLKQWK